MRLSLYRLGNPLLDPPDGLENSRHVVGRLAAELVLVDLDLCRQRRLNGGHERFQIGRIVIAVLVKLDPQDLIEPVEGLSAQAAELVGMIEYVIPVA